MILKEDRIIQAITDYLAECDADELARLTGELFGGQCFPDIAVEDSYTFTPNEFYAGEFGEDDVESIPELT